MKYVLGVDFGGGSAKATLLDETGNIAATACAEYETICIGESGREQRPSDWFEAAAAIIRETLKISGTSGSDVQAVCFDAATHTAVLLDSEFRPVRNSLYWTDTRSIRQKEMLEEQFGEEILKRFKNKVDTVWTLPQLLWIRENEPEVWKRIRKITFAKDYVRHLFTGDFLTDRIEAEGSMLYDSDKKAWSEKYVGMLGLTPSQLPEVRQPDELAGMVCERAAKLCGLRAGTEVICGTTDTAAELFASGVSKRGEATVKLATAGRICVLSDRQIVDRHIVNYSYLTDGLYYPGAATKSCASSLRWFRDAFGGDYAQMDSEAAQIPVGCEGLLFHPYLNGELTPCGDPNLRGSFLGISGRHTRAHFVRAVMEGAALSLLDCKLYLEQKGLKIESAAALGGGAKSGFWRQIVADALDVELTVTDHSDSSLGSAMLAGIHAKFFADPSEARSRCLKRSGRTVPNRENHVLYLKLFQRYQTAQEFLKRFCNA